MEPATIASSVDSPTIPRRNSDAAKQPAAENVFAGEMLRRSSLNGMEVIKPEELEKNSPWRRLDFQFYKFVEQFLWKNVRSFRKRNYVFDHKSKSIFLWDRFVAVGALYSIFFVPMQMVFPEFREIFAAWATIDALLDALFCVDVLVKARTNYTDHGYTISDPLRVLRRYATTWMLIDVVSSVPFDWIFFGVTSGVIDWGQLMKILVIFRSARLIRIFEGIEGAGANILRIIGFMGGFLLIGHWLGLLWHYLAITPLERVSRIGLVNSSSSMYEDAVYDSTYAHDEFGREWLWNLQDIARAQVLNGTNVVGGRDEMYFLWTRYLCSLYWSLNVMTSLKGLENHETRECFVENYGIFNPLVERLYTIFVFVMGAIFYSVIYGTIGQYVRMFYASGDRYRRRVDEINEFARFHRLPPVVTKQIRAYVDFAFAVTKGINVDALAHQLPANLQLEIHIHLNKKMVEQVRIFTGFPKDFFNVLVTKLQQCICIQGDYVFYAGDVGKRMYFVKRGTVEVRVNDTVIKALSEGDYFGEAALMTSQPRTADICAVCDCMLLSLSKEDLESVLRAFPAAKARFEHAVKERLRDLKSKSVVPSEGAPAPAEDSPDLLRNRRVSTDKTLEITAGSPLRGHRQRLPLDNDSTPLESRRKMSMMKRLEARIGGKSAARVEPNHSSPQAGEQREDGSFKRRSLENTDRNSSPRNGSPPSARAKASAATAASGRRRFSMEGGAAIQLGKLADGRELGSPPKDDSPKPTRPDSPKPTQSDSSKATRSTRSADSPQPTRRESYDAGNGNGNGNGNSRKADSPDSPGAAVPARPRLLERRSSDTSEGIMHSRSFRERRASDENFLEAAAQAAAGATAGATENKGGILGGVLRRCSFRRNSCRAEDIPPDMRGRRNSEDLGPGKTPRRRRSIRRGSDAEQTLAEANAVRRSSVDETGGAGAVSLGSINMVVRAIEGDGSRTRDDVYTLSNKVDEMMEMLESTTRQMDELRSLVTSQFVQFRAAQG